MELTEHDGATDRNGYAATMEAAWKQLVALLNQDQRWHDKVVAASDRKKTVGNPPNDIGFSVGQLGLSTNE